MTYIEMVSTSDEMHDSYYDAVGTLHRVVDISVLKPLIKLYRDSDGDICAYLNYVFDSQECVLCDFSPVPDAPYWEYSICGQWQSGTRMKTPDIPDIYKDSINVHAEETSA